MKIPAIRAKIGDWTYYIGTMTFKQISEKVEKINDQLHKSEGLRDLIQRSLTKNHLSISEYILNQSERFFNSIVLAVYNDSPNWVEVELNFKGEEFFNMGFLEFSGEEKIFPVDGQHRVEGIKEAIKQKESLGKESIGVILIGHSKDSVGMQKSRRLFTTLNRYAKPVTMDDIIALDEDDSVAIVTRILLEEHKLFTKSRVTKSKNKAINDTDKTSITSIITLYQCNYELLKLFRKLRKENEPDEKRDKKKIKEYLKFRPSQKEIDLFEGFCRKYWDNFSKELNSIEEYIGLEVSEKPALKFRNKENGGNLLFRPVGLLPFVQASIEIQKRTKENFGIIFKRFEKIDFSINEKPWKNVLWNPNEKTMIMGTSGIVKLLLIYLYDEDIIRPSELKSLKFKYADKTNIEGEDINDILNELPRY
ncbi:DNA sulfur modification protein DndB [Marivirga sp.]|uniref:DNA sulfur modification protein DndB n=1 Tax=Marivirga sp. TaxID=2018662 RepID=UPI002D8085CA|nr:DNA sulfur modification protein DndB [Marivirga sp.]HET8858649.1 DNA sulfur modification protein DndB [Marivirga sp.]